MSQEVQNLVIGTGVAGLTLALKLAEKQKVLLVSKDKLSENNSYYAQGGIASVFDHSKDSFDAHIKDTITVGAGLCHPEVVDLIVRGGPKLINWLSDFGVGFTLFDKTNASNDPSFHLAKEGGHSSRRVVHVKDKTGRAVIETLIEGVQENSNIEIWENTFAVDLLVTDKVQPNFKENSCFGAYFFDRVTNKITTVRAAHTFLCTGGHGKAYLYTSNPDMATGDGLALGWRAGCPVANLEFMQFHPTCLFHPNAKNFLISEAVRGEGGILKDVNGEEFMDHYHPMKSLAPRDVVSRAIDSELKKTGASHVYIDVRHLGKDKIVDHFPTIYSRCLELGIDIAEEMIPVVPAAHYSCGGLVVDNLGRTRIKGLSAIGEVSCTGLHGANRLASNSLLEALVIADRAGDHALDNPLEIIPVEAPTWSKGEAIQPDEEVLLTHMWDEIRRIMWNYVGIVRSNARLELALKKISSIRQELDSHYWHYEVSENLFTARNLALVAWLSIRCAMARKESRGIHYNIDYPAQAQALCKDTIFR